MQSTLAVPGSRVLALVRFCAGAGHAVARARVRPRMLRGALVLRVAALVGVGGSRGVAFAAWCSGGVPQGGIAAPRKLNN